MFFRLFNVFVNIIKYIFYTSTIPYQVFECIVLDELCLKSFS